MDDLKNFLSIIAVGLIAVIALPAIIIISQSVKYKKSNGFFWSAGTIAFCVISELTWVLFFVHLLK